MEKAILTKSNIEDEFRKVQVRVFRQFKKNPDLNAILFLIGIRELGIIKKKFSKEEKQDLMHIAICRLLSEEGYFLLEGQDSDGWPHWKQNESLPKLSLEDQEFLLKKQVIRYFEKI
ncbi:MAG: hypothetical protein EA412_09040 [Chitinophagaceae bacterium]|nr:MAG: hypothetical protein EA412_09040 [Chitinophagaceae bacterium]